MARRKLVYGTGRAQVALSGAAFDAFDAVLDHAIPETTAAIEAETARVLAYARKNAPRESGHFRKLLERGIRVSTTDVTGFVRASGALNRGGQIWHLRWGERSRGFRLGGRVLNDILFKPGTNSDAVKRLGDAVADELTSRAGGVSRG